MAFRPQETESEHHQSKISSIKSKQILSDFTNSHLKNSQASSMSYIVNDGLVRARRRQHAPLTLSTIRRYNAVIKRKNQLTACRLDKNKIPIDTKLLKEIQNFQQKEYHSQNENELFKKQQAQFQRAMYNARQTPLIPLITNIDFPSLFKSSQQQNDLLIKVLTLISNIDEEYSFFEQFKI